MQIPMDTIDRLINMAEDLKAIKNKNGFNHIDVTINDSDAFICLTTGIDTFSLIRKGGEWSCKYEEGGAL